MQEQSSVRRREFLGTIGVGGLVGVAGCNRQSADTPTSESRSPTETATVVFTDTSSISSTSTGTTTGTSAGPTITYDGGDISALRDALVTCRQHPGATLHIEPGTYHFDPIPKEGPGPHVRISGLEDVTIRGNGAEFVFTNPLRGTIYFVGGDNLTIENLTFDYDPVPFTQGKITSLSEGSQRLTVDLETGYPPLDADMFQRATIVVGHLHTSDGSFISRIRQRGSSVKRFESIRRLSDREFELELSTQPGQNPRGLQVGRRLNVVARGGLGIAHALNFVDIDGVTIADIDIHASPGFALQLALCGEPVVQDVTIAPPSGSGRLLGSVADGIHCQNCRDGPVVTDCRLEMLGDDGLIVDEKMTVVSARRDSQTIETDVPGGIVTIESEDILDVMSPTGQLKGSLPPVADVEYTTHSYAKPRVVRFAEPVPEWLTQGDYLSNRSTNSGGFILRNNVVRNSTANSVRIATGPGLIEENELDGAMIHNIWLRCNTSGDFPPKRWINDVVIRENTLTRAGLTSFAAPDTDAIELTHDTAPNITASDQPNHNVEIVNNVIETTASRGIWLADSVGLTISRNDLSAINQLDYTDGRYGFVFANLRDANITENRVEEGSGSLTGFALGRDSQALQLAGNTLIIGGERKPVGIDN